MNGATIPGPPSVAVSEVEYDVTAATAETIKSYSAPIKDGATVVDFGNYTAPGADTLWNQTDDLLSGYFEMVTEHGTHFVMSRFSATNNIAAPWTARATAFTSRGVELTERDAMGRTLGQYVYSSLGADGKIDFDVAGKPAPLPGNDVLTQYSKIERNAAGQRVKSTRFGRRAGRNGDPAVLPAGPDGILFNADDPITELEITTRDTMGHETLEIEYSGPGLDNNWATETDNVVDEYEVTTYVDGIRVAEKEYDAVDGIKDNGDD